MQVAKTESQVGQYGCGVPDGMPVPHGGVFETLRVDGDGTREVELVYEEVDLLVGETKLEEFAEVDVSHVLELKTDVDVNGNVVELDHQLELDVGVGVEEKIVEFHKLELDVGVGVDENIVELEKMLDNRLDSSPEGNALLPSSSSSKSGARVQAGASDEVGCELSPSSSSKESGARVQDGPPVSVGCSLSPSSSSSESGARVQDGPSVGVGCSLSPSSSSNESGARVQLGPSVVVVVFVRGGCSLSPSSLLRSSGARVHIGGSLLVEFMVVLEIVVVVVVPRMPHPVKVASNEIQADVNVSVCV